MFSFFDYLRRRTCDAIMAGAYDAAEILENRPVEEPVGEPGEKILAEKSPEKPEPPKKLGAAPSLPANSTGDLFTQVANDGSSPPLPPRKRGRPPKNPPPAPGQP